MAGFTVSHGAITLFAGYKLGESGSLGTNNLPQDYSGNGRHVTNAINGGAATVGSPGAYSGSANHLSTAVGGDQGWYGPNLNTLSLPTDNFGFSIWVQAAANNSGTYGDVFTLGGGNGAFKLSLESNGWGASAHNVAWISAADGIGGSFVANTWTHLMLIRQNGTATFYINGTASGTTGTTPAHGDIHLSVNPGAVRYFDGLMDEARIVTFAGTDSLTDIKASLVPEPSAALFGGLGMLFLLRRRR